MTPFWPMVIYSIWLISTNSVFTKYLFVINFYFNSQTHWSMEQNRNHTRDSCKYTIYSYNSKMRSEGTFRQEFQVLARIHSNRNCPWWEYKIALFEIAWQFLTKFHLDFSLNVKMMFLYTFCTGAWQRDTGSNLNELQVPNARIISATNKWHNIEL